MRWNITQVCDATVDSAGHAQSRHDQDKGQQECRLLRDFNAAVRTADLAGRFPEDNHFKNKAAAGYGAAWTPGSAEFQYPNTRRASTIWYHDHSLGMTRLNVYYVLANIGPDKPFGGHRIWMERVTENPAASTVEVWEFYNTTADALPIHIHDVVFQAVGN